MKKLLNLVLSTSILALTACDKPTERPNPNADLAQLTPVITITRPSQPPYIPHPSSLNRRLNHDSPSFTYQQTPNNLFRNPSKSISIIPIWPFDY